MKFLSSIDTNKNQTLNFVEENLSSAPLNPVEGQRYYNTTLKKSYYYNGTSWVADGNFRNLLECFWSDHILNDMSYLRADTFSWQDGTTYSQVYNELLSEYNNVSSVEEREAVSANFTKIGSPVVSDMFVAGGFGTYNYLSVTGGTTTSSVSSFEIGIKVRTPSTFTDSGRIFNPIDGADSTTAPTVIVDSTRAFMFWYNGTTYKNFVAMDSPASNTVYWFKWVYDGTSVRSYYSTDGINYILNETTTPPFPVYFNSNTFSMGNRVYDHEPVCVWNGQVYLKDCYFKVNGNIWLEPCNTVTYKRTPKGYRITASNNESLIATLYNNVGIAWYYIIDTVNIQFKLPRTKFGFKGLRHGVGESIYESLPNITGQTDNSFKTDYTNTGSGALDIIDRGRSNIAGGKVFQTIDLTLDASKSSPVYQNDAPVQERGTEMYLYFYVGQFSRSAIEQTAGISSSTINSKVDLNLHNLNFSGKVYSSHLAMPSHTAVNVPLGASGTSYVAPADGYWSCGGGPSTASNQFISFERGDGGIYQQIHTNSTGDYIGIFRPTRAGDTLTINYTLNNASLYFTYAEGSVPE